ncbi:MAG: hypothetical protein Q9M92_10060 [Enterobacterales bacterium]|nr:hypothetical protein [Enterobacterales bacterium]
MKIVAPILPLLFSVQVLSEIPDWYKRDIKQHIEKSEAIILYQVKSVSLDSQQGPYNSYRVETETVQLLKGKPPKGECYMVHSEGEWRYQPNIGDRRIVILNMKYTGECGAVESGFGAPATNEYIELFTSYLEAAT